MFEIVLLFTITMAPGHIHTQVGAKTLADLDWLYASSATILPHVRAMEPIQPRDWKMKYEMCTRTTWLLAILILIAPAASACENRSARNGGSLEFQTTITQKQLQSAIDSSLADLLITQLDVDLQSGYILVTGQRKRANDPGKTDTLTFRLDLGVSGGHLTAAVSNAQLDGIPIEQSWVSAWNQTIANHIEILSTRRPNTALQSVNITSNAVTLTWRVTK